MSTCRAVVFHGDGTFGVREFPVPEPPPGGAVLRVEAVGLCASDLAQLHGHRHVPGEQSPVVPGHEIVGRVHALAPGAELAVEIGERVAVDLVHRAAGPDGPWPHGMGVYGYSWGLDERSGLFGGYGEYMEVWPRTQLLPLTDAVDAAELTVFEPLASVVHWFGQVGLRTGERVLIQGPGHMGLVATALARARWAGTIIVSGTARDGARLAAARAVGAHHTVDVDAEDLAATVRSLTGGAGVDLAIDLADAATVTVRQAIELVRPGGRVLLAGLKNFRPVEIVSDLVVLKGLTVVGGSGSTPASMVEAVRLLNEGAIDTAGLRGEVLGLDELDTAIGLLERRVPERDAIRVTLAHVH